MNEQKSNTSEVRAEQAASKKYQTIKLGLDVHADTIVVVRIQDHSAPQPAQKFTPAKFLSWVKTQLGMAEAVHSCYEAGPFGYGLHRKLREMGVENIVVQPVCLDEQHKGVNNDKSDAKQLALRLDRYVAGNDKALAIVRVPTPEEEQRRVESRQREQLKREVQRVAAQGRGLLLTQGHREKKGWWVKERWEGLQARLPAWLVARLEVFRRVLTALTSELNAATAALEAAAPALRPKGLGGLTYSVVEREIADWGRFKNRRQVGSYTGLCGGVSASGRTTHLLPITKHGNVRLRTALIELAWRLVVWQGDCALVKKWRQVFGNPKATKAARKRAIVAIARGSVALADRASPTRDAGLEDAWQLAPCRPPRTNDTTVNQTDREDLKRRAPGAALGLATTRFGDWVRSFLGYDRMSQLVPSLRGRARIAGRAMALSFCRRQENASKLGSCNKRKKRKSH